MLEDSIPDEDCIEESESSMVLSCSDTLFHCKLQLTQYNMARRHSAALERPCEAYGHIEESGFSEKEFILIKKTTH